MTAAPRLAVDAGNTSIKILAFDGETCVGRWSLPTREPRWPDPEGLPPGRALVCCVVPEILPRLRDWLRRGTGAEPAVLGAEIPLAFPSLYRTPGTLGPDRLAAAAGAWAEVRRSVVVCDAGSAITVDWVDEAGRYRGGAIAPGLGHWAAALKAAAPGLEWGALRPGCPYPGDSSEASCDVGLTLSARGQLHALLLAARSAAGPEAPVVLSGGDARGVLELVPEQAFLVRHDLVPRGLFELAARGEGSG